MDHLARAQRLLELQEAENARVSNGVVVNAAAVDGDRWSEQGQIFRKLTAFSLSSSKTASGQVQMCVTLKQYCPHVKQSSE